MKKKVYVADPNTNYLALPEASSVFNMSASTIKRLAKECNAKIKIGSLARYKRDTLEEYIESLQERRA